MGHCIYLTCFVCFSCCLLGNKFIKNWLNLWNSQSMFTCFIVPVSCCIVTGYGLLPLKYFNMCQLVTCWNIYSCWILTICWLKSLYQLFKRAWCSC